MEQDNAVIKISNLEKVLAQLTGDGEHVAVAARFSDMFSDTGANS